MRRICRWEIGWRRRGGEGFEFNMEPLCYGFLHELFPPVSEILQFDISPQSLFYCRNFIFRSGGAGICPAREIVNLASLYLAQAWIQFATRVRLARATTHCQVSIPRWHCRISPASETINSAFLDSAEAFLEDDRQKIKPAIKNGL